MNPLLKLPAFSVPAGLAANTDSIEQFAYDSYSPKVWQSFIHRASDADTMPVIGAANAATFASMDVPNFTLGPLTPTSPLFGVKSPYWGSSHKLIQKPQELILLPEAGAPDFGAEAVFQIFLTAHGPALIAAKVYINQAGSFLGSYGGGADISLLKDFIKPTLVYYLPANGFVTVAVEGQDLAGGVMLINQKSNTNDANAFIGGHRLILTSVDMLLSLQTNTGYAAWVSSAHLGPLNTYVFRTALANNHKARCHQTDPYFDKILRVYHLYNNQVATPTEAPALAQYKTDFQALCTAAGNCTVVDKGHVAGSNSGVMSVSEIWSYCQAFFGI